MNCKHQIYDEDDKEWHSTLRLVFVKDKQWHQCTKCGLTLLPEAIEHNYRPDETHFNIT